MLTLVLLLSGCATISQIIESGKCPKCGSHIYDAPIQLGYLSEGMRAAAESGDVILGGCVPCGGEDRAYKRYSCTKCDWTRHTYIER